MEINIYELLGLTMEKFSDFVSRYDIELNSFLSEFEDNTESLFIDYQKAYLKKMNQDIIEGMKKLDSNDPQSEFVFNIYEKKLSTNRRILEFLDNKLNALQKTIVSEQKENISKTDSNDKNNDKTKMSWFLVGLNIANGNIAKFTKEGLTQEEMAKKIGLDIKHRNHFSYSLGLKQSEGKKNPLNVFDFDWKIKYINNYCINNAIEMTPEFEKIADKYS